MSGAPTGVRHRGSNGGYGFGRPRFSRADIQDIIKTRSTGASMTSIARRFGCSPEAIRYQLRRHMLVPSPEVQITADAACPRCGIQTSAPRLCGDCWEVTGDLGERSAWADDRLRAALDALLGGA